MGTPLSGPGIGLPLPQNLYPTALLNAPIDASTNRITLAPGQSMPIPAGSWLLSLGSYLTLAFQDPVTGQWSRGAGAAWTRGLTYVQSDGFNVRAENMLGCPLGALVAVVGSGYVQASTTIVPTPGNSTWQPIIGGALALSGGTLVSNGAGYGVAPIVLIPPPPPANSNANGVGGVPATGYCTISSGTVSGFSFTNPGAGYPSAPVAVILPNPTDPNISVGITAASLAFTLTAAGALTGAKCTNPGAPLSNPNQITLTVAGVGSSGSLSALVLQTVTAASVSGQGTGYGTASALLQTVGGVPALGSIANNPDSLGLAWLPRPAQIGLAVTGVGTVGTQLGTIYDGGMFLTSTAPGFTVLGQPTAGAQSIVVATIALTMGSRPDILTMQPAP